MVHNLVQLDHDTREKLEKGGGTKAATKLIRAAFGNSFSSFVSNHREVFLRWIAGALRLVEGGVAGGEPLPDVPEGDEGGGQDASDRAVFQGVSG